MKITCIGLAFIGLTVISCQNNQEQPIMEEPVPTSTALKKGYQLYTIRDVLGTADSVKLALEKTRAMGYQQVESFGYMEGAFFGMSPAEFKSTIDEAELKSPSGHYLPMELTGTEVGPISEASIPGILDAAEALGQKWVVIPWMSEAWRNAEGYEHLVVYLSQLGEAARKRNMVAAWHNHEFEFQPMRPEIENDILAYDYLIQSLEGTNVVFEMDLHWVAFAGEDPVTWFEKYPGKFPLWHVKDFAADTVTQVPVGQGVIDWEVLFSKAELSGLQHYYIEQDVCSADKSLECLKESIDWTKSQLFIP